MSSSLSPNKHLIVVPISSKHIYNDQCLNLIVNKLKSIVSQEKHADDVIVLCINNEENVVTCSPLSPRIALPMLSFVSMIGLVLHQQVNQNIGEKQLLGEQLCSIYCKLIVSFYSSGNKGDPDIMLKSNDIPLCLLNYWSQFYWCSLVFRPNRG